MGGLGAGRLGVDGGYALEEGGEGSFEEVGYLDFQLFALLYPYLVGKWCGDAGSALTIVSAACCLLAGHIGVAAFLQVVHAAFLALEQVDGLDVGVAFSEVDGNGLVAGVLEADVAIGLVAGLCGLRSFGRQVLTKGTDGATADDEKEECGFHDVMFEGGSINCRSIAFYQLVTRTCSFFLEQFIYKAIHRVEFNGELHSPVCPFLVCGVHNIGKSFKIFWLQF